MMTDDTIVIVVVGAPDGAPIKHLLESFRAEFEHSERNSKKS